MPGEMNPGEELVEWAADAYVDLVYSLVEFVAPERPWWTAELSLDAQLWRYLTGGRDEIIGWLYEAGAAMGWEGEEALRNLENLFTDPGVVVRVPLDVQARVPIALIELCQASGPHDAAVHIRKMERAIEGRLQAINALDAARPAVEEVLAAKERVEVALGRKKAEAEY